MPLKVFYTNESNIKFEGLPVLICGSTNGTYNEEFKCSHFKLKNVHLLSQEWSLFEQGEEVFNGRRNSIGIKGIFYEGNLEDVSGSGFKIAFDIEVNNTKIEGASTGLSNGITYRLRGNGGLVEEVSTVLSDINFAILDNTVNLTIVAPHMESSHIPIIVGENCNNISIITPHIFNIKTSPIKIHPSSIVHFITDKTTIENNGCMPSSEVNQSYKYNNNRIKSYKLLGCIPDGQLKENGIDKWTVDNGTISKSMYDRELFSKGEIFNNGKFILNCVPANTSFELKNTFNDLGMLDFEFSCENTQSLKIQIVDSLNTVIYDSGYVKGVLNSFSASSRKQLPKKICGFVERTGTKPYTIKVTTLTDKPFVLHKCEMWYGRQWQHNSGNAIYEKTGEKYLGFDIYKLSGNVASATQSQLQTNTTDNMFVISGFVKSTELTHLTIKDVYKNNYEDRENISNLNKFEYMELKLYAKKYAQLLKRAETVYLYGLGALQLFEVDNNENFIMDTPPSYGYFPKNTKIINKNFVSGDIQHWISNNDSLSFTPIQGGVKISISDTPPATGFIAISDGNVYVSNGKTSASNWIKLNS